MRLCIDCFYLLRDRGELPGDVVVTTGQEHGYRCVQCQRVTCTSMLTTGKCLQCEKTFYRDFFRANIVAVEWLPSNILVAPPELYCFTCAVKHLNVTRMYEAWQCKSEDEYLFYRRGERRLHAAFCDECERGLCLPDCEICADLAMALKYARTDEERAIIMTEIRRVQKNVVFSAQVLHGDVYIIVCDEKGPRSLSWQTILSVRGAKQAQALIEDLNNYCPDPVPFFDLMEVIYGRMVRKER